MIIQLNMRFYCHDLKGFLKAIATYFNHPDRDITSLSGLFNQLEKENQKVLLILHNFDELWHNPLQLKGAYSGSFIDDLNMLRERSITLLCVTEHADQQLQADGSKLHAIPLTIPEITTSQLLAELKHRDLPVAEADRPQLVAWLLQQKAPYSQLDTLKPAWFKARSWTKTA